MTAPCVPRTPLSFDSSPLRAKRSSPSPRVVMIPPVAQTFPHLIWHLAAGFWGLQRPLPASHNSNSRLFCDWLTQRINGFIDMALQFSGCRRVRTCKDGHYETWHPPSWLTLLKPASIWELTIGGAPAWLRPHATPADRIVPNRTRSPASVRARVNPDGLLISFH